MTQAASPGNGQILYLPKVLYGNRIAQLPSTIFFLERLRQEHGTSKENGSGTREDQSSSSKMGWVGPQETTQDCGSQKYTNNHSKDLIVEESDGAEFQ